MAEPSGLETFLITLSVYTVTMGAVFYSFGKFIDYLDNRYNLNEKLQNYRICRTTSKRELPFEDN